MNDTEGAGGGANRPRRPEPRPEHLSLYAETPSVEVTVEIEASPEDIWKLVSDISLPARFSDEFQGARWLDGGPRLGARFVGHNKHSALGEWETTCVVTRYDPNRTFEWSVGSAEEPAATWRFEISPTERGAQVMQWARMGPGRSGLTPAIERMPDKERRIVARRLEEWIANMTANLEGIKRLAEAPK